MNTPQDRDPQSAATRVVIVGATGLVGSTLMRILDPATHRLTVVGRSVEKLRSQLRS